LHSSAELYFSDDLKFETGSLTVSWPFENKLFLPSNAPTETTCDASVVRPFRNAKPFSTTLRRFIFDLNQIDNAAVRENVQTHVNNSVTGFFEDLKDGAAALSAEPSDGELTDENLTKIKQILRDNLRAFVSNRDGLATINANMAQYREDIQTQEQLGQSFYAFSTEFSFGLFAELLDRCHKSTATSPASGVGLPSSILPPDAPEVWLSFQRQKAHKPSEVRTMTTSASRKLPDGTCSLHIRESESLSTTDAYMLSVLLQESGRIEHKKIRLDFTKLIRLGASSCIADAKALQLRPSNGNARGGAGLAPKYLLQLSGSVYSLYALEVLSSDIFIVYRLLCIDALEGSAYRQRTPLSDPYLNSVLHHSVAVSMPNLHESRTYQLPRTGVQDFTDEQSLRFQASFFAGYAIISRQLRWVQDQRPTLFSKDASKRLTLVADLDTLPVKSTGAAKARGQNSASQRLNLSSGPAGGQFTSSARQNTCDPFPSVDSTEYQLRICLQDHKHSKVWIAQRCADGVDVVVKWCRRQAALQWIKVNLTLSGTKHCLTVLARHRSWCCKDCWSLLIDLHNDLVDVMIL